MTDKLTSAAELRRRRPPNRERVDAIKPAVALEIALHELRAPRRHASAARLADRHEPPNVSRIERGDDIRLSTLQRYVAALGGELEIVARFPGGESQTLLGAGVTGRRRGRRSSAEPS